MNSEINETAPFSSGEKSGMNFTPFSIGVGLGMRLLLLIMLSATLCFSQNIASSNLVWEADQVTDTQTQKTNAYKAKFKTNKSTSIEWIQKNGEKSSVYTVTGTEGSWT